MGIQSQSSNGGYLPTFPSSLLACPPSCRQQSLTWKDMIYACQTHALPTTELLPLSPFIDFIVFKSRLPPFFFLTKIKAFLSTCKFQYVSFPVNRVLHKALPKISRKDYSAYTLPHINTDSSQQPLIQMGKIQQSPLISVGAVFSDSTKLRSDIFKRALHLRKTWTDRLCHYLSRV